MIPLWRLLLVAPAVLGRWDQDDCMRGGGHQTRTRTRAPPGQSPTASVSTSFTTGPSPTPSTGTGGPTTTLVSLCPPQPPALSVGQDWDPAADTAYGSAAAERLSKAVQIETVSYDDMPSDPNSPRYAPHTAFSTLLESTFPTVYTGLQHEAVNLHGHLYTWMPGGGGDNAIARATPNATYTGPKPILLMAHIDVVPVDNATIGDWTFPPFSGHVSDNATPATPGKWVWGRGASDTKNTVMGILSAVEKLLADGFVPSRPVLIALGFDEEIGGTLGQAAISKVVQERYGEHGVEFIVDEGFSGVVDDVFGARVASLGMQEVGFINFRMTVTTAGGHSSSPLRHTGIGYMAKFISYLEDHEYPPVVNEREPFVQYLSCVAAHSPLVPAELKSMIQSPTLWPQLATFLDEQDDRIVNAFIRTTAAIDIINGGIKINALPELVNASINHRIAFTSTVAATKQHYIDVLAPYAQSLNFSVDAFGQQLGTGNATAPPPVRANDTSLAGGARRGMPFPAGNLTISVIGGESAFFEPSPVTPANGTAFAFLAGTIKAVWGNDTVVSPTGMYANSDTAWYWNVSPNIFRFTPAVLAESLNQHTVDERISLNAHLSTIRFFYKLIRNTEGWQA